jgi:transposase-like protein
MQVATRCPACGSSDVRIKRTYQRQIVTLEGVKTFDVNQRCCRDCGETFTDEINGVKCGRRIADEVTLKAVEAYIDGPDLEGVRRRLKEDFDVEISTSTIWRASWAACEAAQKTNVPIAGLRLSRYVCVDEKFISVHGRKKPQFFGICAATQLVIGQKLLRNRDETAITHELRKLKRMGFGVVISDDWKPYAAASRQLDLRYQKCHFHAKRAVLMAMKSKHIQKRRKEKFVRWLFRFLDSKDIKEATVWLRVCGRMKREKKLRRFLKSFFSEWQDYFTYLEFEGCPKTSNPIEAFNRRFEQKRQTMHGFRKEKTARGFTAPFTLHSAFRKFESGKNVGMSPLELAGFELGDQTMFDFLPL